MSDVFISYKHEDRARVLPMVEGLRAAGLSVAWDLDIPGGAAWRQALMEQLDSTGCVIVVWSEGSVGPEREFVHEEAVRIDAVEEPLGFGEVQSLDLVGWGGEVGDPRFQEVVAAARAMSTGALPARRAARDTPHSAGRDGVGRLLRAAQTYLAELLALTSGPKQFFADRMVAQRLQWQDGFLFLLLSFLLTFAVSLPFARNPLLELPTELVFVVRYVLLYGYAAFFAWRLVGGQVKLREVLTIHFYLAGVLKLILTATYIAFFGVLRSGDPTLYGEFTNAMSSGNVAGWYLAKGGALLAQRTTWRVAIVLLLTGTALMLLWVVAGWGAYRRLARVGRLRSILAFVVFGALSLPLYAVTALIANALIR
jgi:TIR domain-containing protein